jgi:hypothetical protein
MQAEITIAAILSLPRLAKCHATFIVTGMSFHAGSNQPARA